MSEKVRFIRVNGRIVPIRAKGTGQKKKGNGTGEKVAGAAAVGGGAVAIKKATPLVTGRTTLYHGTTKSNAEKIMAEGLKRNASHGIGDMLDPSVRARNFTYMTKSKGQARQYAAQSNGIDNYIKNRVSMEGRAAPSKSELIKDYATSLDRVRDQVKGSFGFGGGKVTKASVPLWQKKFKDMAVRNVLDGLTHI